MENTQTQSIPKVVVRKIIRAKRERVFEAWTNPELLKQWMIPPDWSARATVDLRVGGKYCQEMIVGKTASGCGPYQEGQRLAHDGEYLEIKAPERLVFTWNSHKATNSRVTVELLDRGDTTEVWITHELLATEEQRQSHSGGWTSLLDRLDTLLAG